MTVEEWISNQGNCCIESCESKPVSVDNMDNVYCEECAQQNQEEEPVNWEDDL